MEELEKLLNDAVENFNSSLGGIQDDILSEIELLIKDIKIVDGNIVQSVSNLKKINRISEVINNVVVSPKYKQKVISFGKAFNDVAKIQDEYFSALVSEYSAPNVLNEIKNTAIDDVVSDLTSVGLEANVSEKISDVLRVNIESGSKYKDMVKELKTFITGDVQNLGALEKYAGQITTDSINQFSATYNAIVSDDLGLEWSTYAGSLVEDSREICKELIHKKYIHNSELPEIVKGHINGKTLPVSSKTKLPYGMIPGTTANNFRIRRGGYRCNHLYLGVASERVPKELRDKFNK